MLRAFIGFAAISLFAACTPSPEELCNTSVETACKKMWECTPDTAKLLSADEAGCNTALKVLAKCAEKKTEDDLCVDATGKASGKKFNLSNADTCNSAALKQSCDDVKAHKTPDPACEKICE